MNDRPAPRNLYDDRDFFAGYATLERFGDGWNRAMEHPDFMALLPNGAGSRILDLGCGAGQLGHHLALAGAASVTAVDLSRRMLAIARAERSHPNVRYVRGALEDVAFRPASFDLIVSSLAIHYVADYPDLMQRVAAWLAPGGVLVFSTEHPIYSARGEHQDWVMDDAGRRDHWPIADYGTEGLRAQRWFIDGVQRYHRTMASLVNGPIDAGLSIDRLVEPVPGNELLARAGDRREEWAAEARRPMFLLLRASKR